MGNFGLDHAALCGIKPDIVMASLSAYGATGPWASVPGIGGTIEPSSGKSALLGYPGGPPLNSGQMYPDPVAGICGFAAIALALLHRERTGQGQCIDLSMQEANFTFIGDAWLEYELTGKVRGPLGNRHPLHAPHGVYPARPAGDGRDQWIAIATESDAQFEALADVLGMGDVREWSTQESRKSHEEEMDRRIASRTALHDKQELGAAFSNSHFGLQPPRLDGSAGRFGPGLGPKRGVQCLTAKPDAKMRTAGRRWRTERSGCDRAGPGRDHPRRGATGAGTHGSGRAPRSGDGMAVGLAGEARQRAGRRHPSCPGAGAALVGGLPGPSGHEPITRQAGGHGR